MDGNSSRNGFAFYIPRISRCTTPAQRSAISPGSVVIPGLTAMGGTRPANQRPYWLPESRFLQKKAKLFRLKYLHISENLCKPFPALVLKEKGQILKLFRLLPFLGLKLFRLLTLALARMGCLSAASKLSGNLLLSGSAIYWQAGFDFPGVQP